MRLIRTGHLSSASVSSVSKCWKMLMARTCIDAEFVVPMLNFLNIMSPRWCLLTSKWLVGRAVQHLCIFVGCTVADQTTELTWKPAGKGGRVYTESNLVPVISQDVVRGFFFIVTFSLCKCKAPFLMCFLPKGTTASELLSQLTKFTFFSWKHPNFVCAAKEKKSFLSWGNKEAQKVDFQRTSWLSGL